MQTERLESAPSTESLSLFQWEMIQIKDQLAFAFDGDISDFKATSNLSSARLPLPHTPISVIYGAAETSPGSPL